MIKKNYKIPEWLNPDEITLSMAERLIAYKRKYQKNGLKRKTMKVKMKVIMKLLKIQLLKNYLNLSKINLKPLNYFF